MKIHRARRRGDRLRSRPRPDVGQAYGIAVRLNISLPGMDAEAQKLVDAAHQVCPYSNATRGNIDVKINLV
jgi:osmotically inducible protein OsmC